MINCGMKQRSIATVLSLIPGFGHLYLGRFRGFAITLLGYIPFSILIYLICNGDSIIPKGENFIGIYLFLLMALICIPTLLFSMIDTEYQCSLMKLPYKSISELHINNYGRAYRISIIIPAIIGMTSSVLVTALYWISWFSICFLIYWSVIALVGEILIRKFRNVKYSDMEPCHRHDVKLDYMTKKGKIITILITITFIIVVIAIRLFIMSN